jgi:hypothetical protein
VMELVDHMHGGPSRPANANCAPSQDCPRSTFKAPVPPRTRARWPRTPRPSGRGDVDIESFQAEGRTQPFEFRRHRPTPGGVRRRVPVPR